MHRRFWQVLALGLLLATGSCRRDSAPPVLRGGASKPAQAVRLLTAHLHDNDLVAFARDAVPPRLHAQLEVAWREGRTRWPLDELPFDERLPALLRALAAPGSEAKLQQVFDRQFSGADAELKTAAASLGLFGAQYIRSEGEFSDAERAHYAQFIQAISSWGMAAPLGDPHPRARRFRNWPAPAQHRPVSEADFAKPACNAAWTNCRPPCHDQQVLSIYGLRLDDSLGAMQPDCSSRPAIARACACVTAGWATDRRRGRSERHGGRWYLSDYLRHAKRRWQTGTTKRPGKDPDAPLRDPVVAAVLRACMSTPAMSGRVRRRGSSAGLRRAWA